MELQQRSNNCIFGVLNQKEGGTEKVHEDIMADTSQIWKRYKFTVSRSEQIPNKINLKKSLPTHIIVKN